MEKFPAGLAPIHQIVAILTPDYDSSPLTLLRAGVSNPIGLEYPVLRVRRAKYALWRSHLSLAGPDI